MIFRDQNTPAIIDDPEINMKIDSRENRVISTIQVDPSSHTLARPGRRRAPRHRGIARDDCRRVVDGAQ